MQDALAQALGAGEPLSTAATVTINGRRMQDNLVIVTNADGDVVAQTPGTGERLVEIGGAGADVLRGSADEWLGVVGNDTSDPLAVSIARVADPRTNSGMGTVLVGTSLAESERLAQSLLLALGVGFGTVLVLAAVVGPRLTRLGLRPLRNMAEASRELARGNLRVRVATSEVHDEVGELARAFNEMAEKLEANFAAQRAFVADASHELRTPLTALGGQVDVLVHVLRHAGEARRLAGFMRRELNRMFALVDDLLVLGRVGAQGSAALDMQPLDLRAVARDVYEQARVLPFAQGRTISLEINPVTLAVCGEPRRLPGAAQSGRQRPGACAERGHVAMRAERRDGRVRVQVQDDGPGIPQEHLSQVFDRFYRTDDARDRIDGGSGLGLAIARDHRGT